MKHSPSALLLALALSGVGFSFSTAAAAASTGPSVVGAQSSAIVNTEQVENALDGYTIIWDARSEEEYNKGHIPGAVNIGAIGKVLRTAQEEDYIDLVKIEELLGNAGIDPSKEIIVYGAKADSTVYFGLTTLDYLSAKNPKIYHGGIDDWKAAGRPLSIVQSKLPAVKFKAKINPSVTVDTAYVLKKVGNPNVQMLDTRTPKEFSGEDIRSVRGGHIPNAILINYMDNWVDPATADKLKKNVVTTKEGMDLKSRDDLKALYSKLSPDKETIVYCQSGVRASQTAYILKELGFKDVKVYDSSWIGYSNTAGAKAENETFPQAK